MYRIDESQAPLIIVQFESPMTLTTAEQLFNYLDGLLAKAQLFGFVMDSNVEGQHEKGVPKMQSNWAKANRDRLGKYCVGMAVTQSNRYIAIYKPLANVMIPRMYNCPGRLFTDLDEAKTWLQGHLAKIAS